MPLFGGSKYVRGGAGSVSAGPGVPTIIGGGSGISTSGGGVPADGSITTAMLADGAATPVKLSATLLTEAAFSPARANTPAAGWYDWDLSATIPAGSRVAFIFCGAGTATSSLVGARANGSSQDRRSLAGGASDGTTVGFVVPVQLDSGRIIEVYETNAYVTGYSLAGWF